MVGILLTIWSVRFLLVWLQVLGLRHGLLHTTSIARSDTPPALAPIFAVAHEALSALGFAFSHAQRVDNPSTQKPGVYHVYWHAAARTYAEVTASVQAGRPFAVELITHFADGTTVATVDCMRHLVDPLPPAYALHDHCLGNLERQWAAHGRELRDRSAISEPVWWTAEEYVAAANQFHAAKLRFQIDSGWLVPTAQPNVWRLSGTSAIKLTRQILRGQKKARACATERRAPAGEILAAEIASDINTFDRVGETRRESAGWLGKAVLFVASGLACAVAFGLAFSWRTVPLLLGTILFHEAGHLVGMRVLGYRDTQILFLPFLGAVALGDKRDAPPHEQLIVYLLGPLPGIILGFASLLAYARLGGMLWAEIGLMALALNGLNLLPVLPFDGGRIVEVLFATRLPRAQLVFWSASFVLMLAVGWWSGDPVLLALAAVLMVALPQQWRWAVAVARVAKTVPPEADRTGRVTAIFRVLAEPPFRTRSPSARLDLARRLLSHLSVAPITWRTVIAGGLVYVASLAAVAGMPLYYWLYDRPDIRAVMLRDTLRRADELTETGQVDSNPPPERAYACPPAREATEVVDWDSGPNAPLTVVGTFDTAAAAQDMAAQMRARLPGVRATVFGHTLFLAALDSGTASEQTFVDAIQRQHGTAFVEKRSPWSAALAFIRCTATSDAIAVALEEDIESYFRAPGAPARAPAPWALDDQRNADEKLASVRARSTYHRLCVHIAQTLTAGAFQDTAERYLRARKARDHAVEEAARAQLDAKRQALIQSVVAAFAHTNDPYTDPEVVTSYLRHLEQHTHDVRVYDLFGSSAPGLVEAVWGHAGTIRSPHRATSAFGGHVRRDGRTLGFESVRFVRTAIGLPAFVHYLCAHGCADIRYGLRATATD